MRERWERAREPQVEAAPQSSVNVEVRDEAGQLLDTIVHVKSS